MSNHERWEVDAAAYALNALDEPELQPFERHLGECEQCRRELAAMRTAVQALATVPPALAAPPELRHRVMETIRAEAAPPRRARRPVIRVRWAPRMRAAIATAAIAVVAIVVAISLAGGGGAARTYAGTVSAPGASASVRVAGDRVRLRFSQLPAPPGQRIYQVWLKKRGAQAPVPTQALFAATTGSVTVPGGPHDVQAVLVTAEPRPHGSREPTRSPVIVVRLA